MPDIRAKCRHSSVQLDSPARWCTIAHCEKHDKLYLKRENVSFIEPQMRPPNSPDLNPVDYAVLGFFSSKSTVTENLLLSIS